MYTNVDIWGGGGVENVCDGQTERESIVSVSVYVYQWISIFVHYINVWYVQEFQQQPVIGEVTRLFSHFHKLLFHERKKEPPMLNNTNREKLLIQYSYVPPTLTDLPLILKLIEIPVCV